jgi:hypothetical protein
MASQARYIYWWNDATLWMLAAAKADPGFDYWEGTGTPFGDYSPQGAYTGTATVEAII